MGNIFARKTKTTFELLDQLDKSINDADEYQKTTQLSQKRYVGYLMIFSSLLYLTAVFVGYFYYYPKDFHEVSLRLVPLLLFPFLIYGLKVVGCWWFVLRLEANQQSLEHMKRKRREILDTVKDKEVYNVAKEILEKFDPQLQLERLQRERKTEEEREKEVTALRQRSAANRRRRSLEHVNSPSNVGELNEKSAQSSDSSNIHPPMQYKLPRPILPRERNALDKMVDYLLGDGPNNRYALICSHCFSHNGMALADDFEYVAYRCAYCSAFNPAKKQRLRAPPLGSASASASSEPSSVAEQYGSSVVSTESLITEASRTNQQHRSGIPLNVSPTKKPVVLHPFDVASSSATLKNSSDDEHFTVPKSETLESFTDAVDRNGNTDSSDDPS